MADSIRMIITRGVEADGSGGTVVDDAAVVLGILPNGVPMLDGILAAFADAYPIPAITAEDGTSQPSYSTVRHLSVCFRNHANVVADGYRAKLAAQAAAAQTAKAKEDSDKAQTVLVNVGDPVSTPEIL